MTDDQFDIHDLDIQTNWESLTNEEVDKLDYKSAYSAYLFLSRSRLNIIDMWGANPKEWTDDHRRIMKLRLNVLDRITYLNPHFVQPTDEEIERLLVQE